LQFGLPEREDYVIVTMAISQSQRQQHVQTVDLSSKNGASTEYGGGHLIAAHYSFIDPERMKG